MAVPDYLGSNIVNLMASLRVALGATPDPVYAPLAGLEPERLQAARNIVLLVIDGLGYLHLSGRAPHTALGERLQGRLGTVFPATTASAVTTFLTGRAPQQHAHTGWFTYFEELDEILATLPFVVRGGGDAGQAGASVSVLLDTPPVFGALSSNNFVLVSETIAYSPFNTVFSAGATIVGYASLTDLFDYLDAILGCRGRNFVYAYWPELDRLAHAYGIDSREVARHLREFDDAFAAFLGNGAGDTLVLATADHGFVDSGPQNTLWLHDHPRLSATLARPLSGEPRAAYCYLKPGREADFLACVRDELDGIATPVQSAALIERGYFGLGEPHPRLARRIGDYTLLMHGCYSIKDQVAGERPYVQIGVHGGTSEEELYVPLVVAER